jgi:hypothetical protein
METSLDFTDVWQSLINLIKQDTDVQDIPTKVSSVTLANRSNNSVKIKRSNYTSSPSIDKGFKLDAEGSGIWYVTLRNVDLSKTFIKSAIVSGTGAVDISVEI